MPPHVSLSIPHALVMAVLPPSVAEAAVETAVAEAATGAEAMVVEIKAETYCWGIQQSTIKRQQ